MANWSKSVRWNALEGEERKGRELEESWKRVGVTRF